MTKEKNYWLNLLRTWEINKIIKVMEKLITKQNYLSNNNID